MLPSGDHIRHLSNCTCDECKPAKTETNAAREAYWNDNGRLVQGRGTAYRIIDDAAAELNAIHARLLAAEGALAWYANTLHWNSNGAATDMALPPIQRINDFGARARAALTKKEPQ